MSLRNYILRRHENDNSKEDLQSPDIWEFPYRNSPYAVLLDPGNYKFECWGALGGSYIESDGTLINGGPGGYSIGYTKLEVPTTVYVCVGQEGHTATGSTIWGGWNGGGSVGTNSYFCTGGGGTDISYGIEPIFEIDTEDFIANRNEESLPGRFIVAGGGSGAKGLENSDKTITWTIGLPGGGELGLGLYPGTLTNGYSFWKGGDAGGGGWYGGRGSGGSGFVNIEKFTLEKHSIGPESITIRLVSYDTDTKKYLINITFITPSDFIDFENSYIDLSVFTNTYSGSLNFPVLEDMYYHLHDMKPHFTDNGEIDSNFNEAITDWIFLESDTGMLRDEHLAIYIDNTLFKPNTSYSITIEGTSDDHLESFSADYRDPWDMYAIYYYRKVLQNSANLIRLTDGNTISGECKIMEPNGTESIGHYGNGYARITKYEEIILPDDHFRLESSLESTAQLSIAVNSLEYLNNGIWEELGTKEVTFGGDFGPLYIRGKSSQGTVENFDKKLSMVLLSRCPRFIITSNESVYLVQCKGDIRYLIDYEDPLNADCSNARFCYLFHNCYQLTEAPLLPITKLCSYQYAGMFSNCISLKIPPELPALVMEPYCYYEMFSYCGILNAPQLPSRVMAPHCYDSMFKNSNIQKGPDLMATILVDSCYKEMFSFCYNLNYLKAMFITPVTATTNYTTNWLSVAGGHNATFIRNIEYNIPQKVDYGICLYFTTILTYSEPFHFESLTSRALIFLPRIDTSYGTLEYALGSDENNLTSWANLPFNTAIYFGGDLGNIYIRGMMKMGTSTESDASNNHETSFYITGDDLLVAAGDLRYIINKNNPRSVTGEGVRLPLLFRNLSCLICAPETYFTVIASYAYWMLYTSTGIYNAGELPATTLSNDCYAYMYYGCRNLRQCVRQLPATILKSECYFRMFEGCRFTETCDLPATTLAIRCYAGMFNSCINLISAPSLPATRLYTACYWDMFGYCTSLINAPILKATTLAESCYANMFLACRSLLTAPALPAITLVTKCYECMFQECSNLNYIKMMASRITDPSLYFNEWIYGVSNSGTFIKNIKATWSDDIGEYTDEDIIHVCTKVVPPGWDVLTEAS